MRRLVYLSAISIILSSAPSYCQTNTYQPNTRINTISTAVPFLLIDPGAQTMGIAGIGVVAASYYSESGLSHNPALLSPGQQTGIKFSFKPWARHIVRDTWMGDVGVYYSLNDKLSLGASFRYFSQGDVGLFNSATNVLDTIRPYDYYFGLKVARNISPNFSVGIGINYLVSNLAETINGIKVVREPVFDLGVDYRDTLKRANKKNWRIDLGGSVLNIGKKLSYVDSVKRFLPTVMRLGLMLSQDIVTMRKIKWTIDIAYQAEKLLVPTPPIYDTDSAGYQTNIVIAGKDPEVSALRGMVQSFYDAPEGINEELNEIVHYFGLENRWAFENDFSLVFRAGYKNQHRLKGNRKQAMSGIGFMRKSIYVDLSGIVLYRRSNDKYRFTVFKRPFSWNVTMGFLIKKTAR